MKRIGTNSVYACTTLALAMVVGLAIFKKYETQAEQQSEHLKSINEEDSFKTEPIGIKNDKYTSKILNISDTQNLEPNDNSTEKEDINSAIKRMIRSGSPELLISAFTTLSDCGKYTKENSFTSSNPIAINDKTNIKIDNDCEHLDRSLITSRFQLAEYIISLKIKGTGVMLLHEGPEEGAGTDIWEKNNHAQWKKNIVDLLTSEAENRNFAALLNLIELSKYSTANISSDQLLNHKKMALSILNEKFTDEDKNDPMIQKIKANLSNKFESREIN